MGYRVAVVGATGNVGREILAILEELNFPVEKMHAIASRKSKGVEVSFGDRTIKCEDIEQFDFSSVDLVLMSAELYAADGDLAAASARLNTLDPHTAALRQVQEAILTSQQIGYARSDIETLARLFQALQAPTPTPGAVVTASPEAQP